VLLGYYLNGAIFLAFSSIAERTGRTVDDGVPCRSSPASPRAPRPSSCPRSGWSLPGVAGQVAAGWAVVVGISVVQRICLGYRRLL